MRTATTKSLVVRVLVAPVFYEAVELGGGGGGGGVRPADPYRGARRPGGRPAPVVRPSVCL